MIVQTILLGLLTLLGKSEYLLGTSLIHRPIILGTLTGLIMGDLQAGIIMGATVELAFIGAVSIGAYIPPDMVSGTILGVAFSIAAGSGAEAALTLGIPIATIMLALNTIISAPILLFFTHKCDTDAKNCNIKGIERNVIWGSYVPLLITTPIVPLAYYFGSDAVVAVLGNIPEFIQTGMDIAGGMIPALGFAMLAQMIMNKKVAPFFFLGYFAIQYFGLSTTGVAIFAAILIVIMMNNGNNNAQAAAPATEESGGGFDEF